MTKILDGEIAIINQLIEAKDDYPFLLWKKAVANNWLPTEINMSDDITQWQSKTALTDDERLLVKRLIGFFSGAESLVGNNLLLTIFKYISDGGCRQYILRQAYEESVHNVTVSVCCSAYDLSKEEVSSAYKNIPSIKAKDDFIMQYTTNLNRQNFDIKTLEGKREFVTNLFAFYIICEGIFFYSGFAMALALGRQNKVTGLGDQIRYTLRDESLHIEFGTYLINRILKEYPEIKTPEFSAQLVELLKKAVDLEIAYAKDALPNGILGLNADMFIDYMQYIGNRRLESIGLEFRFPSDKNPFPWLGESMDVTAMGAFFERRERNYKQASTIVDDL